MILARQKVSWSPTLIAGEFWRYIINIGKRREVLRLLSHRPYAELVHNYPGFAFKYLVPDYLARDFTVSERVSCFLHHYRRLYAMLPEDALSQILQADVTLHEIVTNGTRFAVALALPQPPHDKEGELTLDLQVDGKRIFNLSFTIVPGSVVKSEVAEVLLVTRLQGTFGARPEIRLARTILHEFFPGKLLLAALQGVADAFGINELQAVCATKQKSYQKGCPGHIKRSYDIFFTKLGMVKTSTGFYSSSIPINSRPLASLKGHNRPRARRRRAMRLQIQLACARFFLQAADRATDAPSAAATSPLFHKMSNQR
jgi:uncharacterized protein VirK/YbjX